MPIHVAAAIFEVMSMKVLLKVLANLDVIAASAAAVAIFAMMIQISLDVILKYLFHMPVPMTLEMVASYYMVAVVFLPLGLVTRHDGQICVELFTQGLNERWLSLVNVFTGVLSVVFVVAITYYSLFEAIHKMAINEIRDTAYGHMAVWPARWFVPIGCGIMLVYLVAQVIDNCALFLTGARIMPAKNDADQYHAETPPQYPTE